MSRRYRKKLITKRKAKRFVKDIICLAVLVGIVYIGKPLLDNHGITTDNSVTDTATDVTSKNETANNASSASVPDFEGNGYVVLDDNAPEFTEVSSNTYFETSELDYLGRCGEAKAMVGPETLATEERGSIGMIKPSGWHTQRYDDIIADRYLYNRGHLIMFALYGNETNISENLITETRYANATTQLSFESQILDYIKETGAHVEYHVRPDFRDNELVARGVELQALSDDGGLKLHVYVYNVQPGVSIDYATGESYENQEIFVDGINTTAS